MDKLTESQIEILANLMRGKHGEIYPMHWKGMAMGKNNIFIVQYVSTWEQF